MQFLFLFFFFFQQFPSKRYFFILAESDIQAHLFPSCAFQMPVNIGSRHLTNIKVKNYRRSGDAPVCVLRVWSRHVSRQVFCKTSSFRAVFLILKYKVFFAVHLNRKIGLIKLIYLHYITAVYVCLKSPVSVYYMTVFKLMENQFKSLRFQGAYPFFCDNSLLFMSLYRMVYIVTCFPERYLWLS